MADRLASDSHTRDKRVVERSDDVAKGISDSLHGEMTNPEAKMLNQWETFEQKREDRRS